MHRIAKILTDYVIHKGTVDESDRDTYEYGFIITVEVGLFVLFSLFITLYLHMFVEGIIFFSIFVPLRSYAGGLHLEKFQSCFILSCLTFSGTLLTVRYTQMSMEGSFILILFLEVLIYALYPVENINRRVDSREDKYFRKKLKKFLLLDFIIAMICVVWKKSDILCMETIVLCIVAITMLMGKCKNGKMKASDS